MGENLYHGYGKRDRDFDTRVLNTKDPKERALLLAGREAQHEQQYREAARIALATAGTIAAALSIYRLIQP